MHGTFILTFPEGSMYGIFTYIYHKKSTECRYINIPYMDGMGLDDFYGFRVDKYALLPWILQQLVGAHLVSKPFQSSISLGKNVQVFGPPNRPNVQESLL